MYLEKACSAQHYLVSRKGPLELPNIELESFNLTQEELTGYISEMLAGKYGEFKISLYSHKMYGEIYISNWTQIEHVGGLSIYNLPYLSTPQADTELEKIFQAISDAGIEKISLQCEDIADGQVSGRISGTIIEILSKIIPQSNLHSLEFYDSIGFDHQDSVPLLYEFVQALNQSKVENFAWRELRVGFSDWNEQKTLNFLTPLLNENELEQLKSFWGAAKKIY
jgi:hypothetical protein